MITPVVTNPLALEHSEKLVQHIHTEIKRQNGFISFARFMQLALYTPGLGYYSAGTQKFGREGDFVTAPEISALFSHSLANQCAEILEQLPNTSILEFGAGSGKMAAEILLRLEKLQQLPTHYYILEVSAELRHRQQQFLREYVPQLYSKIVWLDQLPQNPINAVVLANEVLDAMPVHRFRIDEHQNKQEMVVGWQDNNFIWQTKPASNELANAINNLDINFPENFESEINLFISPWLQSIKDILIKGVVLIIDYGFPRSEFYLNQRDQGTLMCHFQHQAHSNPFLHVGLQDITSHIDFTAVAEAGLAAGFEIQGYTNQANFLLSCGITELMLDYANTDQELTICNQVKMLTLPQQMGELFKCIALSKEIDLPLLGFNYRDLRDYL